MRTFRIYRPNLSEYKTVQGMSMDVAEDGSVRIYSDIAETRLVVAVPKTLTVVDDASVKE